MKIKKSDLLRIIKEEAQSVLKEQSDLRMAVNPNVFRNLFPSDAIGRTLASAIEPYYGPVRPEFRSAVSRVIPPRALPAPPATAARTVMGPRGALARTVGRVGRMAGPVGTAASLGLAGGLAIEDYLEGPATDALPGRGRDLIDQQTDARRASRDQAGGFRPGTMDQDMRNVYNSLNQRERDMLGLMGQTEAEDVLRDFSQVSRTALVEPSEQEMAQLSDAMAAAAEEARSGGGEAAAAEETRSGGGSRRTRRRSGPPRGSSFQPDRPGHLELSAPEMGGSYELPDWREIDRPAAAIAAAAPAPAPVAAAEPAAPESERDAQGGFWSMRPETREMSRRRQESGVSYGSEAGRRARTSGYGRSPDITPAWEEETSAPAPTGRIPYYTDAEMAWRNPSLGATILGQAVNLDPPRWTPPNPDYRQRVQEVLNIVNEEVDNFLKKNK